MPNVKTLGEWSTEIAPAQREKALALIGKTRTLGNVAALRTAGVVGSGAHIRTLVVQSGFYDDAAIARGWDIVAVENSTWLVAQDPEHSHWDRANARVLKAYHPLYRDQASLEVRHEGSVTVEHERRLTLADVLSLARSLDGLGTGAGGVLPSSREVLAELVEGQRPAGALSSGSGT